MKSKMFVSVLFLLFSMFLLTLNISANEFDTKSEGEESNNITNYPVASLTGPTAVYAGQMYTWRVGTSSSYGPHTFYFNPGDGTGQQRLDGRGYETSREFNHSYRGYEYLQQYTQTARTADQLSISMPVNRTISVRAW